MARSRLLWIIIIVVLALIGLGVFWFRSSRQSGSTGDENITPTPEVTEAPTPTDTDTPTPAPTTKPTSTPKPPTPTPSPGPTVTPTPSSQTTSITSTSGLDGFRASNNGGNDTLEIRVGRNSNLTMRGFVSFDIPSVLSGKTIESATLRLYQYKIDGTPYTAGGNLLVEHMDYGSTLDSADYSASPFDSSSATVGASNSGLEWKDIDVTTAFKNDRTAGHSRSQYRLKFTTETIGGDVTGDFAYFYSSNSGSNTNPPQLVIKYH